MKFVDLGLPSGLLWATENYDIVFYPSYFTTRSAKYALSKHLIKIPSPSDFEELLIYCDFNRNEDNSIYAIGKNGNRIMFKPFGCKTEPRNITRCENSGYYITSYPNLIFTFNRTEIASIKATSSSMLCSLRLIANSCDCLHDEIY